MDRKNVFVVALSVLVLKQLYSTSVSTRTQNELVKTHKMITSTLRLSGEEKIHLHHSILASRNEESHWDFPEMDIVYTWVNGSDPVWQEKRRYHHQQFMLQMMGKTPGESLSARDILAEKGSNGDSRYSQRDELKYSLRSIQKYAPFIRQIHILVADGQCPEWLNVSHPKINIVKHSQIFEDQGNLPTFNSNAIETNLLHIPGLADYFWYFNDDIMLGSTVRPSDVLVSKLTGQQKNFPENYVPFPQCHRHCPYSYLGNGKCDLNCNFTECGWDHGDCGGIDVVEQGKADLAHERRTRSFKLGSGGFLVNVRYVDGVLNRGLFKAPSGGRRLIKHVPHLMNRHMMQDLKHRFPDEYKWTEEHKFRHPEDMQMAFAYVHYLDGVHVYAPSVKQAWRAAFDSVENNRSTLFLYEREMKDGYELERMRNITQSSAYAQVKQCTLLLLNKPNEIPDEIEVCDGAMRELVDTYQLRLPFEHKVNGNTSSSLFVMINDDRARALKNIQRARDSTAIFITINDDMKRYHADVEQVFRNMYEHRLPEPSDFELLRQQ